jgi:hypothetical protein
MPQNDETIGVERETWPTKPGYYWATLVRPTGEGDEDWCSGKPEIVEVNDNNGEGDETFSVSVFGVPVTQWPANFEWHGPLKAQLAERDAKLASAPAEEKRAFIGGYRAAHMVPDAYDSTSAAEEAWEGYRLVSDAITKRGHDD